jgi:hypothetical protein
MAPFSGIRSKRRIFFTAPVEEFVADGRLLGPRRTVHLMFWRFALRQGIVRGDVLGGVSGM